jgi:hypothetical protein
MRWPTDIHGREVMPFGSFAFLVTGVSLTDDAWQAATNADCAATRHNGYS